MQEAKTIGMDGVSLIRGRIFTSAATFLRMSVFLCLCAVIAIVPFSSRVSSTEVPNILNYQGDLTDNTGQPLTGTKKITFKFYDVASGGSPFWTEIHPTVLLTDGHFSVVLGSINDLNPDLFTGQTFLGITAESGAEMQPRQKLTSVAYAFKAADAIPPGVIVMWSGSADNIPSGWALCDGANETPNLTDRFVIGSGNGYKAHAMGGSSTKNLQHTHTTTGHALTIDQIPSHSHGVNDPGHRHYVGQLSGEGGSTRFQSAGPDSDNKRYSDPAKTGITIQNAGKGQSHSHGDTGSGGSSAQDIMPPYYSLCFIMKL